MFERSGLYEEGDILAGGSTGRGGQNGSLINMYLDWAGIPNDPAGINFSWGPIDKVSYCRSDEPKEWASEGRWKEGKWVVTVKLRIKMKIHAKVPKNFKWVFFIIL